MTGSALLGLALLAAPFSGALWAWSLAVRGARQDRLALAVLVEPDTPRQELTVGVWEPCPWVKAA